MIISLLSTTTFAAVDGQGLLIRTNEWSKDLQHAWQASSFGSFIWGNGSILDVFKGNNKQQRIERIVILPYGENNTLTVMQGETINFTAVGLFREQPVGGIKFKWAYTDTLHNKPARPFNNGIFQTRIPGKFLISATAQGLQANLTVIVNPNEGVVIKNILKKDPSRRTEKEKRTAEIFNQFATTTTREISSKARHNPEEEKRLAEAEKQRFEKVKIKQQEFLNRRKTQNPPQPNLNQPEEELEQSLKGGPSAGSVYETDQAKTPSINQNQEFVPEPILVRPADDDGWDGGNWDQAFNPVNYVGNVPGSAPAAGAGNGNFQLAAPVLSLPGRGINVNLSLIYNSRLWSKSGSLMTYDADKGNPAPGWNIGFGKMVRTGSTGGCMLIQPDGSRQSHDGTNNTSTMGSYYYHDYQGHTTDGSFTDYSCYYTSNPYGTSLGGLAYLANGTQITYGSPSPSYDQVYPTEIMDAQGNYITITYVNNHGPNIQTITDTLGRTITFNYDSSSRLINITGPGYNGATRTFVRLHYAQPTLSYAFASGLTTDTATDTPYLLDAIYYPDTGTGYWFGDSNSYSSYGMIAKIISQRGMIWSGSSGTQGTVTAGNTNRTESYNFDLTANSTLTDAPLYTTYSDSWYQDNGIGTTNTTFSINNTSTTQEITITRPDGVREKQISVTNPGYPDNGMYVESQTIQPSSVGSAVLHKTKTYLANGDYGTTRPTKIEVTDELNQTTSTDFTYGANYNQVTEIKQNNYANALYRKTVNTYVTNSAYLSSHVYNLISRTDVLDSSNNRLSRVDYEYDNQTLVATPDVVMHKSIYDPYTTETQDGPNCVEYDYYWQGCWEEFWVDGSPEYHWNPECEQIPECIEYEQISVYWGNSAYRGNLTKVTTYANAAPSTPTGAIEKNFTYDVTGNQRTAETDCCQQMSFYYSTTTEYSQPESHTKGHPSDSSKQITESATYDFNTGVVKTSTDFNGITTTFSYDAVARPTLVTLHSGGKTEITYGDSDLSQTKAVKKYDNTIVSQSKSYFNGHGQPITSAYFVGGSSWNVTAYQYDIVGRREYVSMPYDSASSPSKWTRTYYDFLSRVTQVTTPDGSNTKSFYNESTRPDSASSTAGPTVRSQDAWGRERWARTDDFGRMVEVVEPNPSPTGNGAVIGSGSSGSLKTSYDYDPLDQLIHTSQVNPVNSVNQERKFAYDSLGRLVLQKLAEQTATINSSGVYVGPTGTGHEWSDAFQYDSRSNLTQRTDARGVITTFDYTVSSNPDPLNRLQSIAYNTASADTTYTINAAPTVTLDYMSSGDKTRVWKVNTGSFTVEENSYDSEGRISDYSLKFNGMTSYPMVSSYDYDDTNRLTEVRYPARYGMGSATRKYVNPLYDNASRLTQLGVEGSTQMSNIYYNQNSQVTQLRTGTSTSHPDQEDYSYDADTGLLTGQTVTRLSTSTPLMDLSYEYGRGSSVGSINGKTGNLTHIIDNLNRNKDRVYEYDGLGRLVKAKGGLATGVSGVTSNWTMDYTYDRYGNKDSVTPSGTVYNGSSSSSVPSDGLSSLSFDSGTNRINTSGWVYDLAGNLIRGQNESGVWQKFEYDAAGRLVIIKDDSNNPLETYYYGASRQRLKKVTSTETRYYVWGGSNVLCEYTESSGNPLYAKSYVYAGSRLLSTATNISSTETVEYQHPDRLGTKLVTNPGSATQFEQATLPFGTELTAETSGTTNQRFTSYDRDSNTKLDYAQNRSYSSGQGRFTQVDPAQDGMNLYVYVGNNPIDFVDPSGLNAADPNEPIYYMDGFEVSKRVALHAIESGLAGSVFGGGSSSIGYWEDFDDWSHPNYIDGKAFPGTGTRFVLFPGLRDMSAGFDSLTTTQDESLSACISGVLKQYFNDVNVGGTSYNPMRDVWFSPGLPSWATALNTIGATDIWAVTYGLKVHFDADKLPNLSKPNWSQFQVMVEEIVHVNQFLDMWANTRFDNESNTPPSYGTALDMWKLKHLQLNAKYGYDKNPLEIAAKAKASAIRKLEEKSSPFKSGPCGP